MNQKSTRFLFLFLAFLPASATSVQSFNLKDITDWADRIFEGRCTGIEHIVVQTRDGSDLPAVRYTFTVLDGLKGEQKQTMTLSQLGHFQDGRTSLLDPDQLGVPKYQVGETYLLFVNRVSYHGLSVPIGLAQGVFDVTEGQARNRAGNRHILTGFEKPLAGTPLESWVDPSRKGKALDREGLPVAQLKTLVRDLLTGRVKAPTRKEELR